MRCDTCQFAKRLPVELCFLGLPQVIAFLYEQDINVLAPALEEVVEVLHTQVDTSVTEDPVRVTGSVEAGGDELTLSLDEQMNVVGVSR
jgi:hypothetical protein